jgi:hypothetical protein
MHPRQHDARELVSGQEPPDFSTVIGWLAAGTAVASGLLAVVRRILNTVTRSEFNHRIQAQDEKFLAALEQQRVDFEQAIEKQGAILQRSVEREEGKREKQHDENRSNFEQNFNRLSRVEQAVSRVAGYLAKRLNISDDEG